MVPQAAAQAVAANVSAPVNTLAFPIAPSVPASIQDSSLPQTLSLPAGFQLLNTDMASRLSPLSNNNTQLLDSGLRRNDEEVSGLPSDSDPSSSQRKLGSSKSLDSGLRRNDEQVYGLRRNDVSETLSRDDIASSSRRKPGPSNSLFSRLAGALRTSRLSALFHGDAPLAAEEPSAPGVLPLAHMEFRTADGRKGFTDENGWLTVPEAKKGSQAASDITFRLEGRYVKVKDLQKTPAIWTLSARPGERVRAVFNTQDASENVLAQVNAYHYVTRAHDQLRRLGLRVDRKVRAMVNGEEGESKYKPFTLPILPLLLIPVIFKPVLAIFLSPVLLIAGMFYVGYTIPKLTFGRSGDYFGNAANEAQIYHEFGHWIHDHTGGILGDYGRGMGEGWADILGTFFSGQPLIGIGFDKSNAQGYLRTGDNDYPFRNSGEEHLLGQPWMGFAWKLRKALIASMGEAAGAALASSLVFPVLLDRPRSIPKAIYYVLLRDKQADGSFPHFEEIAAAAQAHGITLQKPGMPGPVLSFMKGKAQVSWGKLRAAWIGLFLKIHHGLAHLLSLGRR